MKTRQPMQPVVIAEDGCVRFKQNTIIRDMQELCAQHGLGLNELAMRGYCKDDMSQLMLLIGYSVSGYGDFSCSRAKHVAKADQIAAEPMETKEPQ